MEYIVTLRTELQRGEPDWLIARRAALIREAISWESGPQGDPRKYTVAVLPTGDEVYFLKPGKEASRKTRQNPHDMTPVVGKGGPRFRFNDIWSFLSKLSVLDFDAFKVALVLIYRNAYLMDHVGMQDSYRYHPNKDIRLIIDEVDARVGKVFPHGLLGILHFLDVLGWNEDVKYHTENNVPSFAGRYGFRTGRINTLLTCIRVPYQVSDFIRHVIDRAERPEDVEFSSMYDVMQGFANSRGTCTPTQSQLLAWLDPYIVGREPSKP